MNIEKSAIEKIIKEALSVRANALIEPEAKEVLRISSIPVPRFELVKDVNDALGAAERIGYPVVLKIVSADIPHKSDIGGVALNITNGKELQDNWAQMIMSVADESPLAMVEGFLVEEMVPKGVEVIVGVVKDPQFGPLVMFGTGGVAVELMKDVAFRLAPLNRDEALELISEVKGFPLLMGYRGDTRKDIDALADVIIKVSNIVMEVGGFKELEINPLMVYEKGVVAVDARAALGSD